jgi:hypothetical protein
MGFLLAFDTELEAIVLFSVGEDRDNPLIGAIMLSGRPIEQ